MERKPLGKNEKGFVVSKRAILTLSGRPPGFDKRSFE